MGIQFRDSSYRREVTMGKRTVKDGEAVAVWDRLGVHRQIVGPKLVRLFFASINFLDRITASSEEYLQVKLKSGRIEHHRGPISMFINPVFHSSIEVKRSFSLVSALECIVVNREVEGPEQARAIERIIIKGPNVFFPSVGDKVVSFTWTSANDNDSDVVGKQRFEVITTHSKQWKISIPHFSTAQNAANTLHLTLTFCIRHLEQCLDNSTDVTGDMYDALCLDLTNLTTKRGVSETEDATTHSDIFTSLGTYPTLMERSTKMGVEVEGIAFRGLEASVERQKHLMELAAIEAKEAKEALMAKQKAAKITAELSSKQSRVQQEQDLQAAELKLKMEMLQAENEYKEASQNFTLKQKQTNHAALMQEIQMNNDESLRVLKSLHEMGVDLTQLLSERGKAKAGELARERDESLGMSLLANVPALNELFNMARKRASENA